MCESVRVCASEAFGVGVNYSAAVGFSQGGWK